MTFCKYCGKQLADGEVCTCPGAAAEAASYQAAPAPGAAYYAAPAAPKAPGAFGNMMKDIWNTFLNLFKKPVTAAADFIRNSNKNHAFLIFGIQAIIVTIFMICFACKHNGEIQKDFIKAWANVDPTNPAYTAALLARKSSEVNIFMAILTGILGTAVMAFIIPAISLMFVKLFKGNTNYQTMLKATAVGSLVAVPFVVVGILLFLIIGGVNSAISLRELGYFECVTVGISIHWGLLFAFLGYILGGLLTFAIMPETCSLDRDKQVYAKFLTGLVVVIVLYFFVKLIGFNMCASETIKQSKAAADAARAAAAALGQ